MCRGVGMGSWGKAGWKHECYIEPVTRRVTKSRARLTSYSGHHIKTLGTTNLTCVCKNVQHNVQFFVTEMDSTAILGVEACQRLGLIERLCSVGVDITEEYADSFKGLGCLPGEYKIKLDPSVPPVVHAPRKVPVALHDRVKEELQRMENDGVIKKQEESTDWVNSMVIVETSKKPRICIDPRDLNKAIKREHFPMKTTEEVVQNMPGASVLKTWCNFRLLAVETRRRKLQAVHVQHSIWILSLPSCSIWQCLDKRNISAIKWCLRWSKTLVEVKPAWTI